MSGARTRAAVEIPVQWAIGIVVTLVIATAGPTTASYYWQGNTAARMTSIEERQARDEIWQRDRERQLESNVQRFAMLEAGQAEIMRVLAKIERKLGL